MTRFSLLVWAAATCACGEVEPSADAGSPRHRDATSSDDGETTRPDAVADRDGGASRDADRPDARAEDAAPLDGTADGWTPDAARDHGPSDAGPPDLFAFEPEPLCVDVEPVEDDLPGGFDLAPAPLGTLANVGDLDGDGRSEVHAFVDDLAGLPPEEAHRAWRVAQFRFDAVDGWRSAAEIAGMRPLATLDLGPPFGRALVGSQLVVDPFHGSLFGALGVRAGTGDGGFIFDETVALFVRDDPRGGLETDYLWPPIAETLDGDGDGRPEILTYNGDLIEWVDGRFEVVWRVRDADPRDDGTGVGGATYGGTTSGDFDGDGWVELVIDGDGSRADGYPKHARVFENTGDDTYRLVTRLPFAANNSHLGETGDVDGDGAPEFLFGGAHARGCLRVELWTAAGDDAYRRLDRLDFRYRGVPSDQGISAFGDLDGDGDDEVVLGLGRVITAWDWDGERLVQILGYPACERCAWSPVWTGDIDGDGIAEVLFSEPTPEEVANNVMQSPTGTRILKRSRVP